MTTRNTAPLTALTLTTTADACVVVATAGTRTWTRRFIGDDRRERAGDFVRQVKAVRERADRVALLFAEEQRPVEYVMPVLHWGNALAAYRTWPSPTVIISDGAYGIGGFEGDPHTPAELPAWYAPHVQEWTRRSSPRTTLWFWNTEVGWAHVHPLLLSQGWEFVGFNIWNKGLAHIAGNVNSKTIRKFPVVTEACAQYVLPPKFHKDQKALSAQEWLREEWLRTGLPFAEANKACGVKSAATRKWLTSDRLWYMPPPEAFTLLVEHANKRGDPAGKPYFAQGGDPLTAAQWATMRSQFRLPGQGITNVWSHPAVRGEERVKSNSAILHGNQKPRVLMELLLEASSEKGDVVWEPFGGLCTASVVGSTLGRHCFAAEHQEVFYLAAKARLNLAETRDLK